MKISPNVVHTLDQQFLESIGLIESHKKPMCLDCGEEPEANGGGICHLCLGDTQQDDHVRHYFEYILHM